MSYQLYTIDALYRKESRLIFQPKSSKTVLVWLSLSLPGQHSAIYTAVVQGHIKSIQRIELTPGTALMQSNQTTTTARQSAVVTQWQSTGDSSQRCPGLGLTPGDCQPFHFPLFLPHNMDSFLSSMRQDALSKAGMTSQYFTQSLYLFHFSNFHMVQLTCTNSQQQNQHVYFLHVQQQL